MATQTLPLLVPIILSLLYISSKTESAATTVAPSFIRSKCRTTTYPAVCVQSLSLYASTIQKSPRQLAQTALSVSLQRAQSTHSFVIKVGKFKGLKPREYAALKDCSEEMSDTVDRLNKAVIEMKNVGKGKSKEDFMWHISNVETWVSAALTDDTTCKDGFSGRNMNGRVKNSIGGRVTNVAQVTSNALALVNQYAGTL